MNAKQTGSYYEKIAAQYLSIRGYTIIEKNFRCISGEIDMIARQGKDLVFIEVKYRRDERDGTPLEAVDEQKRNRIRECAAYYLYCHHMPETTACRFDVVGITGKLIEVITDAF